MPTEPSVLGSEVVIGDGGHHVLACQAYAVNLVVHGLSGQSWNLDEEDKIDQKLQSQRPVLRKCHKAEESLPGHHRTGDNGFVR